VWCVGVVGSVFGVVGVCGVGVFGEVVIRLKKPTSSVGKTVW